MLNDRTKEILKENLSMAVRNIEFVQKRAGSHHEGSIESALETVKAQIEEGLKAVYKNS